MSRMRGALTARIICAPPRVQALARIKASRPLPRAHAQPDAMADAVAEYNARWEKNWHNEGEGLPPGGMWDAHRSSPALDAAIAAGRLGDLSGRRVFVPGCGRGYDLVTFARAGAAEAVGLDIAPTAVPVANAYVKGELGAELEPRAEVVLGDFFDGATHGGYDVGYDYTFMCALLPSMRGDWAAAWAGHLRPGGLLATLIFPVDPEKEGGPPHPVKPEEYKELLGGAGFALRWMEAVPPEQSHPGRGGKEFMAVWERLP